MAMILLVDDDESLRRAIGRALRNAGYEVHEAPTGREAMQVLDSAEPDLVLTDINMPEMDGIEVLIAFSRARPLVPIVAMSGGGLLPKQLLLHNAEALGAAITIEKPFELQDLLATVGRMLEKAAAASAQPKR
jgi:DNA-binding NtrC family response regulator